RGVKCAGGSRTEGASAAGPRQDGGMPGAAISIRGLTHRYRRPGGHGDLTVLDDLDLDVAPGEHVVVTGVSGSGKSTLLALVGGLDRPREGSIVVGGRDLRALSRNGL